jgi:hypothetical protein
VSTKNSMKLTFSISLNLLSVLSFLRTTEASNFLKYLLCGGHSEIEQPKYKKSQVVPLNYVNQDITMRYSPSFSNRNSIQLGFNDDKENESVFGGKRNITTSRTYERNISKQGFIALSPVNSEAEDNAELEELLNGDIESETETKFMSYKEKLEKLLNGNGVHIKRLNITEIGARELLKIKIPLNIILSSDKRVELMAHERQFFATTSPGDHDISLDSKIQRVNIQIAERLKKVRNLKDFLILVIRFYQNCFANLLLKDCTKAILASDVFEIFELPEIFGMRFDKIFEFACENNLIVLAKKLIRTRSSRELDLVEGVLKVYRGNNEPLCNKLLTVIRREYGLEPESIYHNIIFEIMQEQKQNNE